MCDKKFFIFKILLIFSQSICAFEKDIPKVLPKWSVKIIAENPNIMDPVSFALDEKERIYVCESFRQEKGVEDNRTSSFWLDDDLSNNTNEDRLEMYLKYSDKRQDGMNYYQSNVGQIRRLLDIDGDGFYEKVEMYAGGFNGILDGTIAGVISSNGKTWIANIPNLWQVQDLDNDGIAEKRKVLHKGFGVRIALRGHDLHGLTWGPEGRLWFSIGDRGYHVESYEGKVLKDPRSGAIFRCEPDGSNLEVYARSLRNPQEIAFDIYGNLITGDNNSDAGDKARIVYVVEGGESGWAMEYQTLEGKNQRGPWNQEKLWETKFDGQAAWILPPIAHLGSGPSGIVFEPGVDLPEKFKNNFFLCDFRGSRSQSQVIAFSLKPKGASFEVSNVNQVVSNILPTDIDFDYKGSLLISDYGEGWVHNGKGMLWKLSPPDKKDTKTNVKEIMSYGFVSLDNNSLSQLIRHKDRRIRQRAQFELAKRKGVIDFFIDICKSKMPVHIRLHGIWGLAHHARLLRKNSEKSSLAILTKLLPLLKDSSPIIRGQVSRVLGEGKVDMAADSLIDLALLDQPQVAYHAIMALGRLKNSTISSTAAALLTKNGDKDPFLRHGAVMALAMGASKDNLEELSVSPDVSVRMGALLAMRIRGDNAIARFLTDENCKLVLEASRAIYDLEIYALYERLVEKGILEVNGINNEKKFIKGHEVFHQLIYKESPTTEDLGKIDFSPVNRSSLDAALVNHKSDLLHEKFSARIFGLLNAPADGSYRFKITADDRAVFRFSMNESPQESKELICLKSFVDRNSWSEFTHPIYLSKGNKYWFELRYANDGGISHGGVGWITPGGKTEQPIGLEMMDSDQIALIRRCLGAAQYLGTRKSLDFVAQIALNSKVNPYLRLLALQILENWEKTESRDIVLGRKFKYQINSRVRERDKKSVLSACLPVLINDINSDISTEAIRISSSNSFSLNLNSLTSIIEDKSQSLEIRKTALRALGKQISVDTSIQHILDEAIKSASLDTNLASAVGQILYDLDDSRILEWTIDSLKDDRIDVKKEAIRILGQLEHEKATILLENLLDTFLDGDLPRDIELEVLESAKNKNENQSIKQLLEEWDVEKKRNLLEEYRPLLFGGNSFKGEEIFKYKGSVSCLRCHAIQGIGGSSGPSLDRVGDRLSRAEILQSIIDPNAVIVEGYGSVSSMPSMKSYLSDYEIRDLIAYLSELKN